MANPPAPTREVKLVAPGARGPQLAGVLAAVCPADPTHPHGLVTSVYFDTPDLRFLARKRDSDYLKTKVRLRWYADVASGVLGGAAFLEVKTKVGAMRRKHRLAVPIATERLAAADLESELLGGLVELLPGRIRLPGPLRPVVAIAFERRRFIDPSCGARVAVDRRIRVVGVHRGRFPRAVPGGLGATVVELKGAPTANGLYRLLRALGLRRRAFSKYAACLDRVIGGTRLG